MWKAILIGIGAGLLKSSSQDSVNSASTQQCKHCGRFFTVSDSVGYKTSMELFTCDWCYRDGKRDWATDYHDENTF